MKTKTYANQHALADPRVSVHDPQAPAPDWNARFGREAPLHVELGMGSGHHLAQSALRLPEYNHVGIEAKTYRVYKGTRWIQHYEVTDRVRFLIGDLFKMSEVFAPGAVDRLTMLFPDPWARSRGERFRLTNPSLIEVYKRWLRPGGQLHFRTDHEWLFHYSVERLRRAGFELEVAIPVDRVISDFEHRFLGQQLPIWGLIATRPR